MIEVLEKQKEEHQQIIEEQKEVLDKMKQHLEADEEVKKKDEDIIGQNQMPQQQVHCVTGELTLFLKRRFLCHKHAKTT